MTHQPAFSFVDPERAARNLDEIQARLGRGLVDAFSQALNIHLPTNPDADMALNNLERLLATRLATEALPLLLADDARHLGTLLLLLGTSQFFADTLCAHPEFLDLIVQPGLAHPADRELADELHAALDLSAEDVSILRAFRQFRQRHLLRIGINDIIHDRPLEEITADLSRVADASLEGAYRVAHARTSRRFGQPLTPDALPVTGCVLAFGKLGGEELNYSSDIDLMFVYGQDGQTSGRRRIDHDEFFGRVVGELTRLLSSHTDSGQAYRVDLRLRPEGNRGALARSVASTLHYYDQFGRTWERQALIKLRPVAGDRRLGEEMIQRLEPFIYRKYLGFGEINEIKALKRQIERKTREAGVERRDVKTGHGGIRDIEFTIQFLQLLNGGDLPDLRQRSTLKALQQLEAAGCLTDQEYRTLEDSYRFLRKTEHRLQLLSDWQTHKLPESPRELDKLARRMGYIRPIQTTPREPPVNPRPGSTPAQKRSPIDESEPTDLSSRQLLVEPIDLFLYDCNEKTRLNRTILEFLLHDSFAGSEDTAEPESDLILTPEPDAATIHEVLGRFPFRNVERAYQNLTQLAREEVLFLSARRCRHFLAGLAPELLQAVAETPDPDLTLTNLEKVSASLGAKAVLWELFRFNPPSLRLYVDLCSSAPFLSEILIANPGMIDELLDSLVLNRQRAVEELRAEMDELTRGATDLGPIWRSFLDKELLRIGVRDILGKDDIRATTAGLSDLAETILSAVFTAEARRQGEPPCPYAVVGMGKLGGREMSYHSDLDLLVLFAEESEEATAYFTGLIRATIGLLNGAGPGGRLYSVDLRLRPDGQAGQVALALSELERYHALGSARFWERQTLTRARCVHGEPAFVDDVRQRIFELTYSPPHDDDWIREMALMRQRLEMSASPRSLKRCPGGMMDVEFLTQSLLFRAVPHRPDLARQNIWDALDGLRDAGEITVEDHYVLIEGYTFLRRAEARVRLVTNRALSEYPEQPEELTKLARRMGYPDGGAFLKAFEDHTRSIRAVYTRSVVAAEI